MEVLDPAVIRPGQQLLERARCSVNSGEGLNAEKDVELVLLSEVSVSACKVQRCSVRLCGTT